MKKDITDEAWAILIITGILITAVAFFYVTEFSSGITGLVTGAGNIVSDSVLIYSIVGIIAVVAGIFLGVTFSEKK